MANDDNLKGHGFHERTAREQRELARLGGKKSGESRRKKADFKKTLNALLTAKIDSEEWSPLLESLGLESTVEAAVNAAMIREALTGNVKAYEAIAKYSGQAAKTDMDEREQEAQIARTEAQTHRLNQESTGEEDDGIEIINDTEKTSQDF